MIRYDQLESAWIHNKSNNLSVKAHKTTASGPQRSAESHDSQTHKHGATPVKGRRKTVATTPHHVTCAMGLSADPTNTTRNLATLKL